MEHVRDVSLRRELKSIVRSNPQVSFISLRREAIRWVEEGERPSGQARVGLHHCEIDVNVEGACRVVTAGKGLELSTLQKQLDQQQSQIDTILKSLSIIESVLNHSATRFHNPNYQFTTEGLPICLRCRKPGHVLRQCRQGARPRTSSLPNPQSEDNSAPTVAGASGMHRSEPDGVLSNASSFKQPLPVSNISKPLLGSCPVVEVVMGGVKVKCLLVTGSMVTTITELLFKESFHHWGAPRLKSCGWLALKAANGLDMWDTWSWISAYWVELFQVVGFWW